MVDINITNNECEFQMSVS